MRETQVQSLGWEDPLEKEMVTQIGTRVVYPRASLVTQTVKNLPAMRETWVRSLGWEDPLEEGMATYSSLLA